jgi:hypothetical protein
VAGNVCCAASFATGASGAGEVKERKVMARNIYQVHCYSRGQKKVARLKKEKAF